MGARRKLRVPSMAQLAAVACLVALPITGFVLSSSPVAAATTHRDTAGRSDHLVRVPRMLRGAARLVVEHHAVTAPSGEAVVVQGRLLPGVSDVEVDLMTRVGRSWRTVGHGLTQRGGQFDLRYRIQRAGGNRGACECRACERAWGPCGFRLSRADRRPGTLARLLVLRRWTNRLRLPRHLRSRQPDPTLRFQGHDLVCWAQRRRDR